VAVQIRRIARRPQAGRRMGLFLLDGIHLVEEALDSPHHPESLLCSPKLETTPRGRRLFERIVDRKWPLLLATDELVASLAPTDAPQGILGLFRRPTEPPEALLPRAAAGEGDRRWPSPARGLLLAGLQDPTNVGALARTARALACPLLVTSAETADPYHVRALRASSGAMLGMQVAAGVALADLAAWAAQERALLIGLDARRGRPVIELAALREQDARPQMLVLGSEGAGIPEPVDRLCTEHVRIPMVAAAESLGVLAAGTIALHEWARGLHLA
jgi:TrmH family RNA methyltransferase